MGMLEASDDPVRLNRDRQFTWMGPIALALIPAIGCGSAAVTSKPASDSAHLSAVTVVTPKRATISRTIRQPGTIQAFEQTAIYAKIPGYIEKWYVDIGDRVRKNDTLADLFVPEMVEELKQKEEAVKQTRESYEVAKARVATAAALIQEAQAGLQRADANRRRWQLEYDRMSKLSGTVIDTSTKDEALNQFQSATAAWKEAEAKIETAKAAHRESEAVRNKSLVDISAAEADRGRMAALLGYAKLPAPFDGVVTRRTVNSGDFVQAPAGVKGEPLFVVERRDIMRIFVEVPEIDAVSVSNGAAARVRVQALGGEEIPGQVVRTSYGLDRSARTLLAEIDLANPQDRLRPGMYAYASITVQHANVLTLPISSIVTQGDVTQGYQSFCYQVVDGKARRLVIDLGARDAEYVEVLKKQVKPTKAGETSQWVAFTGQEEIVFNNAASLTEGQDIKVERK